MTTIANTVSKNNNVGVALKLNEQRMQRIGGVHSGSYQHGVRPMMIIDSKIKAVTIEQVNQIIAYAEQNGYRVHNFMLITSVPHASHYRWTTFTKVKESHQPKKQIVPVDTESIAKWYTTNGFTADGRGYKGRNGHTYRFNRQGRWSSSKGTW